MGPHHLDAPAAEAGTALPGSAASAAAAFISSLTAVAAAFVASLWHFFFHLYTSSDTAAAVIISCRKAAGPAAVDISSSRSRCMVAAKLPAAKATSPLLTAAAKTTTSISPSTAAAPSLWRRTATIRLGASAAVLLTCAATGASAGAAASPYQPGAAIMPTAAFSGEEGRREGEQPGAVSAEQSFVSPAAAGAAAAGAAAEAVIQPSAAGAAAAVEEAYRRSGAAAYDWYTPGSAQPAAPLAAGFRETLPALYGVSFLHDFLNYSTAVLWFAAYAALLRRVYVARNIHGLSLQSLFALVWVEVNNVLLIAVLSLYHRKPLKADFFLVDVSSAAVSMLTFLYVFRLFRGSYERERDNFGKQLMRFSLLQYYSKKYYFAVLYVISLCLAVPMFLFRRASFASPSSFLPAPTDATSVSAAATFFSSSSAYASPFSASSAAALLSSAASRCTFYVLSFWECFNDTVLALALLPQLCMLYNKRPRKVTSLLATFMALLFFARVCAFFYWMTFPLFHSTYPAGRGIHLITETLNIFLLSDFLYYYLKARFSGENDVALPL